MTRKPDTNRAHVAQDRLMAAMQVAFNRAREDGVTPAFIKEMSDQMARVEELFGYEPRSWQRGV